MAWNELKCPYKAYKNQKVEVTATTDDESIKRAVFEWRGAIYYDETVDSNWRSFPSSTWAKEETGRVDIKVVFYDGDGYAVDEKSCYFDVE